MTAAGVGGSWNAAVSATAFSGEDRNFQTLIKRQKLTLSSSLNSRRPLDLISEAEWLNAMLDMLEVVNSKVAMDFKGLGARSSAYR